MLDIARLGTAKWTLSYVFVPRRKAGLCFRFVYRYFNAVTARDHYPTAKMDKCTDLFWEVYLFSAIDESSDYWQIKMVL